MYNEKQGGSARKAVVSYRYGTANFIMAHYKMDVPVRCASPYDMEIAEQIVCTWKRKYVKEKTTEQLKNKQPSIASVPN